MKKKKEKKGSERLSVSERVLHLLSFIHPFVHSFHTISPSPLSFHCIPPSFLPPRPLLFLSSNRPPLGPCPRKAHACASLHIPPPIPCMPDTGPHASTPSMPWATSISPGSPHPSRKSRPRQSLRPHHRVRAQKPLVPNRELHSTPPFHSRLHHPKEQPPLLLLIDAFLVPACPPEPFWPTASIRTHWASGTQSLVACWLRPLAYQPTTIYHICRRWHHQQSRHLSIILPLLHLPQQRRPQGQQT